MAGFGAPLLPLGLFVDSDTPAPVEKPKGSGGKLRPQPDHRIQEQNDEILAVITAFTLRGRFPRQ